MKYNFNTDLSTPILALNYSDGFNNFHIKREDLLPFSFGGNKVRIAAEYFNDMLQQNFDSIISYGNRKSNMNRVIANMSKSLGIPCYIVSPRSDDSSHITNNRKLIDIFGAEIIECDKSNVANTIEKLLIELKLKGLSPYYINGNKYGKGNEKTAVSAYSKVYQEVLKYEAESNTVFDYIFHASGTGITQAGLISGKLENKDTKKIVGVSISRDEDTGTSAISHNLMQYFEVEEATQLTEHIHFIDHYTAGGYGEYNDQIDNTIRNRLIYDGIYLDRTYTGKAFWGMTRYLKEENIRNSNILFIHTGSTPLFFDDLNM